jgi:hypothetical protein
VVEDRMGPVKIVVRYKDGRIIKGNSLDFSPSRPFFRLQAEGPEGSPGEQQQIQIEELKAVFFVKKLEGDSDYSERKGFVEEDRPSGRKVEITFEDGETMQGSTLGYNVERSGFFLFPADPDGNNDRVFVVSSALRDVRFL